MSATVFDDLYGSKYLSGVEVGNQTLPVEIGSAETVELRQKDGSTKRRLVLSFPGQDKQLVLNKTNATTLAQLLGKDHRNWIGAKLELFTESTTFGLGIRLRPLRPTAVSKPRPAEMNDDIPY
jgi:hypothetical protein